MLGLFHLSVLKSIFNKQSQPSGYTHHVNCSVLLRVPRCLIVYLSCTLPLLAYFISRMWLDCGDICSSRFCLVSVSKFLVRILFANSMLSPLRFYASWASRSSKAFYQSWAETKVLNTKACYIRKPSLGRSRLICQSPLKCAGQIKNGGRFEF